METKPKAKKLTSKQLVKKLQESDKTMVRYNKAKQQKVECLFCKSTVNLWTINRHLKSERCLQMKALLLSLPGNENTEAEFLIYINGLKKENQKDDDEII